MAALLERIGDAVGVLRGRQPDADLRDLTVRTHAEVTLSDALNEALSADTFSGRRRLVPTRELLARGRAIGTSNSYGVRFLDLVSELALSGSGVELDFTETNVTSQVRDLWEDFTLSTGTRGESLPVMQKRSAKTLMMDGEAITRFGLSGRLQIIDTSLVEYDYAYYPEDIHRPGRFRGGIVYDGQGNPLVYRIRTLQGEVDVPASQIIHIRKYLGTWTDRGVTWFGPVLNHLKWLSDYDKVFLKGSRFAASMPVYATLPKTMSEKTREKLEDLEVNLDAEKFRFFENGVKLEAIDVSKNFNGTSYEDIRAAMIATAAAGLGVTYDFLSGDVSRANMSSLQSANVTNTALIKLVQRIIADMTLDLYDKWLFLSIARGQVSVQAAGKTLPTVKMPRVPSVIPHREAQVDQMLIASKVLSPQTVARERGYDPEEEIKKIIEFNERVGSSSSTDASSLLQAAVEDGFDAVTERLDESNS